MKKKGFYKKITTFVMAGFLSLSSFLGGCTACDSKPSEKYAQYNKPYSEIKESLKPRYYTYSAIVPGEMNEEEAKEYVSELFDDVYVFVDPGPDAKFLNDYKENPDETEFYKLVAGQIDLFAQNLYDKLLYVYGTPVIHDEFVDKQIISDDGSHAETRLDVKVTGTGELLGNNIQLYPKKTLVDDLVDMSSAEQQGRYIDVDDIQHLNYIAGLVDNASVISGQDPINVSTFRLDGAIRGNWTYKYTVDRDGGTANPDTHAFSPANSTEQNALRWDYWGPTSSNRLKDYSNIMMGIAEVLSGKALTDLSPTYNELGFLEACRNIDHLGYLNYDLNLIKDFVLNKVIGTSKVQYDREAYNALLQIAGVGSAPLPKDTDNGNVVYNSATDRIKATGGLGYDYTLVLDYDEDSYQKVFEKAHNYKAYELVVDTIVDRITEESFSEGAIGEDAFLSLPRLNLLVLPMNVIDGSTTTEFHNEEGSTVDWNDISSSVEYHPVIKNLVLKAMVIRTKDGLVKTVDLGPENNQYEEGINITDFETVLYSEQYGADIDITVRGKANGEEILNTDGSYYGFTEKITADSYPTSDPVYPATTYTPLLDEELAKEDWVGNQMMGYSSGEIDFRGADMVEVLLANGITPEETETEGGIRYNTYTLNARLNKGHSYIKATDRYVSNFGGERIYLPGYILETVAFGNNFLIVDFNYSNIVDSQGSAYDATSIPVTILSINPVVSLYQEGTNDYKMPE